MSAHRRFNLTPKARNRCGITCPWCRKKFDDKGRYRVLVYCSRNCQLAHKRFRVSVRFRKLREERRTQANADLPFDAASALFDDVRYLTREQRIAVYALRVEIGLPLFE